MTFANVYSPEPFVSVEIVLFVALSMRFTFAPTITAPVGSLTEPVIWPVSAACGQAVSDAARIIHTMTTPLATSLFTGFLLLDTPGPRTHLGCGLQPQEGKTDRELSRR